MRECCLVQTTRSGDLRPRHLDDHPGVHLRRDDLGNLVEQFAHVTRGVDRPELPGVQFEN